jgi:hypothetical protein
VRSGKGVTERVSLLIHDYLMRKASVGCFPI